ncbi:MAG: M48 family metalloprotease [Candidatus Phlomobacter fragariae]
MNTKFTKQHITLVITIMLAVPIKPVYTAIEDNLPDIGTTAGGTLTIDQEIIIGDALTRQLRASTPFIYDPLLNQYINHLGIRLVKNAHSVKTPFHFYLINNPNINAYTYFGGNVVLHSALFRYSQNESQMASVIAHEISHVTQRHLARMLEDRERNEPLAWIGAIGSTLLMIVNPQAGIASLTGTLAGGQQGIISFTQSNEQEADRIGIQTLRRAGFDPRAMPDFMQILADQSHYMSKPPEMLLTHPLPYSRLADVLNRSNQYPKVNLPPSLDFMLARIRILTMYSDGQKPVLEQNLSQYSQGDTKERMAADYGHALLLNQDKKYQAAANIMNLLLAKQPANPWFIDLMTDIDIGLNQPLKAISRLQNALTNTPNDPVLQINLANAYIANNQYEQCSQLLRKYTFNNPNDLNGWSLLAKVSTKRSEELAAYAEGMALRGNYNTAIQYLTDASRLTKTGSYDQARYDAGIDALRQLQIRDKQLQKR